jgi:superfamily II DNA/RNA helicase
LTETSQPTTTTPTEAESDAPAVDRDIAAAAPGPEVRAEDPDPDDAPYPEESDYPDEPEEESQSGFADLGLSPEIVRAVTEKGYTTPTPIQAQAIPYVLMGRDLLGTAQTGTGKTAGFTLPMIDILSGSRARARMPRSLILEPTRELALQVAENFIEYGKYLKLTHALVIGGESMSDQKEILMRGVDVLIATPGRLMDMFERGSILLSDVKVLVIDEADRMLDMGFIPDVEKIVSLLPKNRQTLFFSATMAPEIKRLADAFLQNPKLVAVDRAASVATTITEAMVLVAETDKREALRRLIRSEDVQNALIFCNRKKDVDILYKSLGKHGFSVGALHGDMAQPVRFATLEKFKAGELRLLCCSDVAARGIDIGGLSHVFNFDAPHHSEDYVHRIGRTGRAGREGRAFTLATPEDRQNVDAIEKLIGHPIPRIAIDGLDVVEWAESDGRRRGRGRAAPKRDEKRAGPKAEAKPVAERPPASEKPRPARDADAPPKARRLPRAQSVPEVMAEQPEVIAEVPVVAELPRELPRREEQRDRPRRDEGSRDRPRRDDESRDRPRRDEGPRDRPRRDDESRDRPRRDDESRDRGRRDEAPRDRPRRDEEPRRGRGGDDLGPRVVGFGDEIPAFMLIAARPSRPISAEADTAVLAEDEES